MDTKKSDKIVQKFRKQKTKYLRRQFEFSGDFEATPEEVFPLLCPAREGDWIPGWDCDLIYTETGYAEDKCVWRTDDSNSMGGGLWAFTGYKKNEYIEFVKLQEDVILQARIELIPRENGFTTGTWKVTSTALTKKGNKMIEKLPEGKQDSGPILVAIDHYLKTGEMIPTESTRVHGHLDALKLLIRRS